MNTGLRVGRKLRKYSRTWWYGKISVGTWSGILDTRPLTGTNMKTLTQSSNKTMIIAVKQMLLWAIVGCYYTQMRARGWQTFTIRRSQKYLQTHSSAGKHASATPLWWVPGRREHKRLFVKMITSIEVIDKRLGAIDKVPQLFGRWMAEFAFEIGLDLGAVEQNSSSSMSLPLDCFLSRPNMSPDNWIHLPNGIK